MSKEYKKGDSIVMNFHYAGVVSQETLKVVDVDEKTITTSEVFFTKERDENRKFSVKTGKCLNDSTNFGAYRTVDI